MLALEQEFRCWANQLRGGDNDFLLVARDRDNQWQLVFNKRVEPIECISIASDVDGDGYCTEYEYDWFGEYPDEFFWCAFLINKAGDLLCKSADGFHGLCVNEEEAPLKAFAVSIRTETFEFHYEYKNSEAHISVYHLSDHQGAYSLPIKEDWIRSL